MSMFIAGKFLVSTKSYSSFFSSLFKPTLADLATTIMQKLYYVSLLKLSNNLHQLKQAPKGVRKSEVSLTHLN